MLDYPLLTSAEFHDACQAFLNWCKAPASSDLSACNAAHLIVSGLGNIEVKEAVQFGQPQTYLRIVRSCSKSQSQLASVVNDDPQMQLPDLEEDGDNENQVEVWNRQGAMPEVEYDIFLSPTYRVPVLYFSLRGVLRRNNLEEMYRLVVPDEWESKIHRSGPVGAISWADHPLTCMPTFFVHPCNTAEAMQELSQGMQIDTDNYIQIWLGLVGKCVGLEIPRT